MGRPSKLTIACQERICEAIRSGAHLEIAAQHGGVTYQTFRNWMLRGQEAAKGRYFDFFQAITRAELETELLAAGTIKQAWAGVWGDLVDRKTGNIVQGWVVAPDWHAAEAWLKRRHSERWGNTTRLVGADGGPIRMISTREEAIKAGKERARHLRAV